MLFLKVLRRTRRLVFKHKAVLVIGEEKSSIICQVTLEKKRKRVLIYISDDGLHSQFAPF